MKWLAALLAGLIAAFLALSAAQAAGPEKRVALIVGNSHYVNAPRLANPANDARLMAAALRKSGFEVIDGFDLDKAAMTATIDRFAEAAYDADIALVYYAGHGVQVDGRNYLVPVDAAITSPAHLKTRTLPADDFLAALPASPAVGIVILDASRDNPMAKSLAASATKPVKVTPGLAAVEASGNAEAGGMLVAFATGPGTTVLDGPGENGPYATALARHLTAAGVEIQTALKQVGREVAEATAGRQRPWYQSALSREVFLGGSETSAPTRAPRIVSAPAGGGAAAPAEGTSLEFDQRLWDEASKGATVAHYEAYLEQLPKGRFAKMARLHISSLGGEAPQESASAEAPATGKSEQAIIKTFPGTEASEAAIGLDRQRRIDLQVRLEVLGYELGNPDGNIGPKSRVAIGAWQKENGIVRTTFLTREQYSLIVKQTDPKMAAARAKQERATAAAREKPKQQTANQKKTQKAADQKKSTQKTQKVATNVRPVNTTIVDPRSGDIKEGPVPGTSLLDEVGAFVNRVAND